MDHVGLVESRFDHDWPEGKEGYAIWAIGPLSEASTPRKPVVLFHKTLPKGPAWTTSDLLLDLGRPSKCSAPLVAAAAEGPSGALPSQQPLREGPSGCTHGHSNPSVPSVGCLSRVHCWRWTAALSSLIIHFLSHILLRCSKG